MTTETLTDRTNKILILFGLPADRPITMPDLNKAKIVRDFGHFRRLQKIGFPAGRWLSANVKIWMPEEVGTYLLNLPTEKPVQPPKAAHRAAAKSVKVEAKRTPKKARGARR